MKHPDDKPVAGGSDENGPGSALSPPERHSKLRRNPAMVSVIVICVVAVLGLLVAQALMG